MYIGPKVLPNLYKRVEPCNQNMTDSGLLPGESGGPMSSSATGKGARGLPRASSQVGRRIRIFLSDKLLRKDNENKTPHPDKGVVRGL